MKNNLPGAIDKLFTLAEGMANGCNTYQNPIGLMHTTENTLRAALLPAQTGEISYQAGRAAKANAVSAQDVQDANAATFITKARDLLKTYLGNNWSELWEQTGFPNQSLAVPGTLAERMQLLRSLEIYFTAHAAQENAPLGVTAIAAKDLYAAFSTARSAVNNCLTDVRQKRTARDTAVEALRKKMRDLVNELNQLLDENDGRWQAFGLNIPGGTQVAEVPQTLVLSGAGSGHLFANWANSARADRYRVYKQVVGVDTDFVLAATVTESEANLNTFAPGSHVKVRVTAVNDSGESQPSAVVEQTVP
jgi:hypothetical protein